MALPEPVRRGQVHPKDYQNEEYYSKLSPLVTALAEEIPDAKYDAKQLAIMLLQILHFQEAALGKDAMPPRICPKLPIRLITDPSVNGALHAIAVKVYEIKRARALKAIEWQNPGKRKECLEILVTLRRDLERRRLLKVPLVYISPSLGNETQRLREYVRRLQANLAESPDEAGVTHMVFPFGPGGDPDDGKEYTTVVAVKGNMVRVHYWYQPDSYDEWIPAKAIDSKDVVPDKAPPGGRWKVTPRWVVDSEKYNEWMNPADYTTPEFDAEIEAAEARGKDGKRVGGSLSGAAKKARTDAGPEVSVEPLAQLDAHVVTRKVLNPHKALTDTQKTTVENLSQGQTNTHLAAYLPPDPPQAQQPPAEAAAAAAAASAGQQPAAAAAGAAINGPVPRPVRQNYSAPVSASWFRYDSIHEMERAGAPDFFNGRSDSKTPKLYRLYRDAIIGMYLELPAGDQLSFAAVREAIEGAEVTGLQRIYDLLVNWGIINHNHNSSLAGGRLAAAQRIKSAAGKLSAALPPGTACLFEFQRPSRLEASAATQQGGNFNAGQSTATQRAPGSLLMPAFGRRGGDAGLQHSVVAPIYCSAMPWVECTALRYHCIKHPDINLCPAAYAEGRFPPGCSSRDFVRIDGSSRQTSSDGWRPEETLLLLEGIELYKEDWAAVAAHVGTRSQAACLMHFVRLPMEDAFIEDIAGWSAATAAAVNGTDGQQQQQQQHVVLPFQEEHNPVMSTITFLAVLMGPKVAAAAAQRALQVIAENETDAIKDLTGVAARIAEGPPQEPAAAAADGDASHTAAPAAAAAVGDDSDVEMLDSPQQQQNGQNPADVIDPTQPIGKLLMVSAAAAGLAAAAVRCQLLAEQEEREIQRLMVVIADLQQKKVDAKTKLFVEITQVVEKERQSTEASLKQLQAEYTTVAEQRKKAAATKEAQQQQARQKALAAEAMAKKQKQQQQQQQQQAGQQEQKPAVQPAGAAATTAQGGTAQQQQQQQRPSAGDVTGVVFAQAAAARAGMASLQQQQQQPKAEDAMDEDDDFDMP